MLIKSNNDIPQVLDWIDKNDKIAFDIETTGLNVRKDSIIGFGISNETESFYIAHKAWTGGKLDELIYTTNCITILKALIGKKLIAWNASFDLRFTLNYFGVDLIDSLWCEGIMNKHTVAEDNPFRLKDVAKKLFGADAAEEQRLMKESIKANGGTDHEYFKADLDIMSTYCQQDCKLTYRINEHYLKIMKKENLEDFYFKDEVMPVYKEVTIPMELSGVHVDVKGLEAAHSSITADIAKLEQELQETLEPYLDDFHEWYLYKEFSPAKVPSLFKQALCKYANLNLPKTKSGKYSVTKKTIEALEDSEWKEYLVGNSVLAKETVKNIQMTMFADTGESYMFNLSSKDHLKRLFFDKLGEDPVTRTDKGAPQMNDFFLDKIESKYEWVRKLRNLNKLTKLEGSYIGKWLRENEDGIYYPSWFNHRTVTGRYGGDLMQMPRKIEHGDELVMKYTNSIRDYIIAGDGYKLVGADYSALEITVFADDAGDEPLLDMIRNNDDFYSRVCIDMNNLGDKYSANKKADNFLKKLELGMRNDTKPIALGLRYGMKSYALSKKLNISETEAKDKIEKYFAAYPKLTTRMEWLINFAKTNGYVVSKTGRVRHLPLLKSLASSWGDDLLDGLKLWKKYHDSPSKYANMKYLSKQYKKGLNQCLNFPIQSMAASIVNRSSISLVREFRRVGLDATIIMNIHDELVVRCKEEDANRVSKIMQFIMENTVKLSVPLTAEPQIGDKYGEIK